MQAKLLSEPPVVARARRTCIGIFFNIFACCTWLLWPRALRDPSVSRLRALAGLPRLTDPFADRDAFDTFYERQLEIVRARKWGANRLSNLGILINALQVLTNILIRRDLARAPPLEEQRRRKRIYIGGPFRTGTTLLQRLLSVNPACKSFSLREFKNPIKPNLTPIAGLLKLIRMIVPHMLSIHPMEIDEPEECLFLLQSSVPLAGMMPVNAACVEWHADLLPHMPTVYGCYSDVLGRLTNLYAAPEHSHLALKCPVHGYFIDALHAAVRGSGDDLCVLRTYRKDLTKVAASFASLSRSMLDAICLEVDLAAIEETAVQALVMQVEQLRRTNALAETDSRMQVIDVDFDDLVKRPARVIEALCSRLDLPYDGEATAAILAQAERSRKQKDRYASYHSWTLQPRSIEILRKCEAEMAKLFSPIVVD